MIGKYTSINISLPEVNIAVVIAVGVLVIAGLIVGAVKAERSRSA